MKKILIALLIGAMVCFAGIAYAIELQAGADTEFVLNKEVKLEANGQTVKADASAQYYDVTTIIKLGDIVKLMPKIGINTFQLDGKDQLDNINFDSDVGWNVGIDAEIAVAQTKYADLAAIGSYRYSQAEVDEVDAFGSTFTNPTRNTIALNEYEIGAKVSKNLSEVLPNLGVKSLTPYFGIVYSDLIGTVETKGLTPNYKADIEAENNIGLRLGLACEPVQNLLISVDGKLVDETAIGGKVTYKF
jgi:hypothetical protein